MKYTVVRAHYKNHNIIRMLFNLEQSLFYLCVLLFGAGPSHHRAEICGAESKGLLSTVLQKLVPVMIIIKIYRESTEARRAVFHWLMFCLSLYSMLGT